MKKLFTLFQGKKMQFIAIFLLPFISVSTSWAQTAIFNPSMSISPYGSVDSNGSEGYANSIDNNVYTKFLDNYPVDGIGFTVDLGGVSKIASSISVTTANDSPGRDPKNYEVLGSNDGSNFTSIATGIIQCISTRFSTRFYCFENSTAYKYYRVNFTNTCSEYIFQFAEVQLYTPGPGVGGSVSANQSISGVIATTPSGEANLNSGSFVQIKAGNYTFEPVFSFTPGQTAAQSFKTSSNLILSAIKINVAEVITAGSYSLTIFQGEGTSGVELINQVVSITNSGTNTFTLDTTLGLIGEQSYTFKLETSDGNAKFNWTNSSGADYSRGTGYTNENNNNSDYNFQLVYQNNFNWQSVTLTDFFGGIQKWQKATDSIFSTPIDIPSIAATLEPYLVGDIFQTTYIRAVVGCSSVYSDYVTVTVNSFTTSIKANQCGVTLASLNANINADYVPNYQAYRFEVNNGSAINTIEVNKYNFNLTQIPGITYGTTYGVRVAVKRGGTWGDYGVSCNVTTPALSSNTVISTKINPVFCGTTLAALDTKIATVPVYAATGYCFEITKGGITTFYNSSVYNFRLADAGVAAYGTTFTIRVAAQVNSVYGNYGVSCNVTTPTLTSNVVPTTALLPAICGTTLSALNTKIGATLVYNATGYRFEITANSVTTIYDSAVYNFKLSQTAVNVSYNTVYDIRVAALINGVYGNFGTSCTVTTPADPNIITRLKAKSFEVAAYPNPFESAFNLNLETPSKEEVTIAVYDMMGKLIETHQVNPMEVANLQIGNNFAAGIYNVIVSQANEMQAIRLIRK